MKIINSIFALALLGLFSITAITPVKAEIQSKCDAYGCSVKITGVITKEDIPNLRTALAKALDAGVGLTPMWIPLNSHGGDAEAALRMGEILRDAGVKVRVYSGESCMSSCVLILASSASREIEKDAKVGIHRPFLENSFSDYESTEKRFEVLGRVAQMQFDRVGVSRDLWHMIVGVPSEKIQILSTTQLLSLKLNGNSAAFADASDSAEAKSRGISKLELFRRREILDSCLEGARLIRGGFWSCLSQANLD